MADYLMPSLGADMDEGTLIEWLVGPGDPVHRGQVVAVVDTSKSAIEVEVFQDGVVGELLVPVGTTVPVGTPLATILEGAAPLTGSAPAPAAESESPVEPEPEPAPTRPTATVAAPTAAPPPPARVSPVVRHHAHELGVDLATVHGSGPDGQPTRHDVDTAARAAQRPRVSPYARRRARELGLDPAVVAPGRPGGVVRAAEIEAAAAAPRAPGPSALQRPGPPRRRAHARRGHARRDRPADGPLEARDPALLPADVDRPRAGDGVAG